MNNLSRTVRAEGTVAALLEQLSSTLGSGGVLDPSTLSADIIAALLEVPRSWPAMNRGVDLDVTVLEAAHRAAGQLLRGAPFAYAVGTACFRNLILVVDERVLIPRPETEVLVGEVLERMQARAGSWGVAVDVGTGSGAIALSLAAEGKFERVIATDVSLDALAIARENAVRAAPVMKTPVEFRHGSELAPLGRECVDVIVSNPPYVAYSEAEALPAAVRDWEPPLALFSGHDGMRATAEIVRHAGRRLVPGGLLALEVDERRASLVAELMMADGAYANVGVRLDLAGRERFVFASRV